MPVVEVELVALVQPLEEPLWLGEVLFYPELTRLASSRKALEEGLRRNAVAMAEGLDPIVFSMRSAPPDVALAEPVHLTIDPPGDDVAWREPLELRFDVVCWTAPDGTAISYVPTLELEVAGSDPDEVATALEAQVRTRLLRPRDALSLQRLASVHRRGPLEMVRLRAAVDVPSPLQRLRQATVTEASALEDAATDLARVELPPAYQVDDLVLRLAELITAGSSVLLVGPSGVGKTALCHELVRRRADVSLERTPFWETSGARLVAGQSGFGMWQERCERVWREASRERAVLVLGNLVELMEVGRSGSDPTGIAEFLRPYLMRGGASALVECTPEQHTMIEREAPRLLEPFERLVVPEPDPQTGRDILRQSAHGALDDDALATLDRLHRRYATASVYPGRPLRFLHALLDHTPKPDASEVTAAFSRETGLPLFLLDDTVPLHLHETRRFFAERVIGQPEAVDLVVDLLAATRAGLTRPGRPLASLLFIGPTGVGKTEMARCLAELLFRDREAMARFDMSEYADPSAVRRLIGPSGRGEGLLTARVRERPFSVVLLDELEKADASFFDLLLQVLGDARLTDAAGRLADFRSCVVVMTSNLGAATFRGGEMGLVPEREGSAARHFTEAVRAWIRPELFNRIDRIVPFAPLDADTVRRIAARELQSLVQRDGLNWRGIHLEIAPAVADLLATDGFDPRYGARPLKRELERRVLAPLAEALNGYAPDASLQAHVEARGGAIQVRVSSTGTSREDPTASALACDVSALRRRAAAIARGPGAIEAGNELYRLEQAKHRQTARIALVKRALAGAEQVEERSATLEDDVLLTLYARTTAPVDDLRDRLRALEGAAREAVLDLYALRFEASDQAVVGLFGDQPHFLRDLARAYHSCMLASGLVVRAAAYRAGPLGAEPIPRWESEPDRLAPLPADAIGVALHAEGRLAWPRFQSEGGLHVFQQDEQAHRCVVNVELADLEKYRPPADVHRKSGLQGRERRRSFLPVDRAVDDALLGRRLSWPSRDLEEGLALALDAYLMRAAEARVL